MKQKLIFHYASYRDEMACAAVSYSFADLSEEHVTAGGVNVVVAGVAGVDHEAVDKLHGLGTLTAQLAGDHNLATLRPGLHDEAKNTIARSAR